MSFLTTRFEKMPVYGWTLIVIVGLLIITALAVADWTGVF